MIGLVEHVGEVVNEGGDSFTEWVDVKHLGCFEDVKDVRKFVVERLIEYWVKRHNCRFVDRLEPEDELENAMIELECNDYRMLFNMIYYEDLIKYLLMYETYEEDPMCGGGND